MRGEVRREAGRGEEGSREVRGEVRREAGR